ncbi:putative ribonuclease H-like domain-containing protein [Tanacetum coccineum]
MDIIKFCGSKRIKREYSNARTLQQNRVAERKNRILIEAARTMLADLYLPNTFWAEAVSTACYVLNRVLVTKPQNKTPYELITGKIPIISYIRPFGCHATILNTIDHLGKFEEKFDEGFLVGYSLNNKAFRHVTTENKANKTAGPKEANHSAGTKDNIDTGYSKMEAELAHGYFVLPLWSSYTSTVKSSEAKNGDEKPNRDTGLKINEEPKDQEDQAFLEELKRLKRQEIEANDAAEAFRREFTQCTEDLLLQAGAARATSTNTVNTVSTPISTASPSNVFSAGGPDLKNNDQDDSQIPTLEDIYDNPSNGIFTNASYDDEGTMANFTNLETTVNFRQGAKYTKVLELMLLLPIFKSREEIITRISSTVCLLACFLSQIKPKKISQALEDKSFVDPKFPKKVYKVVKALYGLHQAPRAWYATLSTLLWKSGYRRETIDKTLFIKKDKNDIMLVQVYLDDIIFGSTKRSWCDEFEALMKSRCQMSSMGELTFFLRLQVKQKEDGIFISQDKYVAEILKKFDFCSVKTSSTTIETHKSLTKDEEAADVDVHLYRSMIGSLMYLTASRPDIMFAVCSCSMFQLTPKTSHLHAVKRIFRYLKGKPKLGLWYPRVSSFDLEAYSDSDYAGVNLDRKSTTGGCQFLGRRLISCCNSSGEGKWQVDLLYSLENDVKVRLKLSTARPKLSTDSTKIESMKLEAMMEERRIFKCWFHNHTTNGHQFTMSNRHQELASPEQTASELASPKQTALALAIPEQMATGVTPPNWVAAE